jgi:hypothetical protein
VPWALVEGGEGMLMVVSSYAQGRGEHVDTIIDPGIAPKSYIRIKEGIPAIL